MLHAVSSDHKTDSAAAHPPPAQAPTRAIGLAGLAGRRPDHLGATAGAAMRSALRPSQGGLIQRKCDCGGDPGPTGECAACHAGRLGAQTKLTVNRPGDVFEQEADRNADAVMHAQQPVGGAHAPAAQVQRFCAECGDQAFRQTDEEEVQAPTDQAAAQAPEAADVPDQTNDEEDNIEEDDTGMPKREAGAAPVAGAMPSMRVPHDAGQPLAPGARDFMESRFGQDFSPVRVHADAAAATSARHLQAHAYTVGRDIYFNSGQYAPESFEGRKLLAHELTHVVQQTGPPSGQVPGVQRQATGTGTKAKTDGNVCSAGGCPQGKQSKAVRGDCAEGGPADENHFIKELNVSVGKQKLDVVWSNGDTETWECSPNSSHTPKKQGDVVGTKCSKAHTNRKKDGMAWFTGFASEGLRIGFHDSQRVGKGIKSHGCVRVCCDKAQIINANSWSGKTVINVS
jgi:hypothetical protein